MIKNIFFLLTFILLSTPTKAQNNKEPFPNNRFGIVVGYNYSYLPSYRYDMNNMYSYDPYQATAISPMSGFLLGASAQFKLTPHTSFQPVLEYSTQGETFSYQSFTGNGFSKRAIHLSYLTIPLNFKFYTGKTFNFQVSPYFAFLLTANQNIAYSRGHINDYINNTISSLSIINGGLSLGIGYDFNFGLSLASKVSVSFANYYRNSLVQENGKFITPIFSVEAGYNFGNIKRVFKKE